MRMGSIFARGSCRALKWTAMFGVVFALGAGSALAQTTVEVKSVTVVEKGANNTVGEGDLLTVRVTLDKRVPRADAATTPPASVTVSLTVGAQGTAGDKGEMESGEITVPQPTIVIPEQTDTGTVNILVGRDLDAVDEKFMISAVTSAATGVVGGENLEHDSDITKTFNGTIVDAEEQEYEFKVTTAAKDIKEGNQEITLTLRADPERPLNEDVVFFLQMSDTENFDIADNDNDADTPSNQRTLSMSNTLETVTIMAGANDENRTDDMLMIDGFTGSVGRSETTSSVSLTVLDIHNLPDADAIEAEARDDKKHADGMVVTSVAEGGTAYVWVEVTNTTKDAVFDDEEFTVSLAAVDQNQLLDYRVSPASLKTAARGSFTSSGDDSEMVGPFTLEALSDEDIGEEDLMLYVNLTGESKTYGAGESNGMFSIMIEDTTSPLVWARSTEEIEAAVYAAKGEEPMYPDGSFEIMTADLFEMAEDVTVAYSATSDSDAASASASASMVTVTAEEAGMAHITVTGTASMMSGAKPLPQTVSNIAQIIFPVEVMEQPMTYMLSGPEDDMNIAEGGMGAMITVTANQAVAMDTEVMVMRDRAMSSASDDDYMLDPMMITIMAGEMMGSAMVTAVEDDMMEEMEELVLYAMAGDMEVEGAVKLYLWDMAAPALPLIAQLLLAAFLALGGYRRYLRR